MRKKMKLFIAMVSVGALLGTMPVMAAEQPELPTKVQDIANGSDELYGEGANYAQTECQFRYCGTAIPFLTVRSTAR